MKIDRTTISVLLSVTLIAWSRNILAWNEPLGFRDIPFGTSEQILIQKLPRPRCGDNEDQSVLPERFCSVPLQIGSVEVLGIFYLRSGRFVQLSISFKSEAFSQIEEAFAEKYGKASTSRDEEIKTRGGLEAMSRILEWRGEKVKVRLERYAGSIAHGSAELITLEEEEFQLRRIKNRGKTGAKDL